MQVALRRIAWGLLLALGACDAEKRTPEKFDVVPVSLAPRQSVGVPTKTPRPTPVRVDPPPAPKPPGDPAAIKVGMSREAFVDVLGDCARRTAFVPPAKNRLVSEVFQPANADCIKRFGARRFLVLGGKLSEILAGVDQLPPPGDRRRSDEPE